MGRGIFAENIPLSFLNTKHFDENKLSVKFQLLCRYSFKQETNLTPK